jgi:5'-nucleotidase
MLMPAGYGVSMPLDLDWNNIDTVLLDMDGTLLDLAFDSQFWLQDVPQALSLQRAIRWKMPAR